jgi:hypothetical protein
MSYLGRSAKLSLKAQEKVSFLATAGQTVKTGLSYTPSFIEVYVNGVLLTDTTDFTATNGNSITFTVALLLNDEVTVISLKTFTVADHYNKTEADTLLAAKSPLASPSFTGSVGVNASSGATYPTLGTASGSLGLSVNDLHGMYLGVDGSSGNGWLQAMREDGAGTSYNLVLQPSGGNVGVGVVPETSGSNYNVLQIGQGGSIMAPTATEDMYVGSNVYRNSSNTNSYIVTEKASIYEQYNGEHYFNVAPSGSADAAISFAQGMKISNAGYVAMPKMATTYAMLKGPSSTTNLTNNFTAMQVTNNPDSLYNASNGRFTCPVAGLYQMTFMSINESSLNHTTQAYPFVNGSEIAGGARMYESQNHNHGGSSATAIIQCAAGDYLQWRMSGSIYGERHSGASYMLVHAS